MKLYVFLLLASSASIFALEDNLDNALPKSILEIVITSGINNYFHELSHKDPFHIEYANKTVHNHTVHIRNLTTEGFSKVEVTRVKTWGFFFSKHISIELNAPRISSSVEQYAVVGPNNTVYGNLNIQLESLRASIEATVNILTHNIKKFEASFHLNRASAQIVAISNNEDYSQNVTKNVNDYLNFGFNQDYALHKKLSEGLKQLLEGVW